MGGFLRVFVGFSEVVAVFHLFFLWDLDRSSGSTGENRFRAF